MCIRDRDVKSQLDNLALLTGQIEERRKYINTIESDVHILTSEIASLQKQLNKDVYKRHDGRGRVCLG